jgi:hypothetical protein
MNWQVPVDGRVWANYDRSCLNGHLPAGTYLSCPKRCARRFIDPYYVRSRGGAVQAPLDPAVPRLPAALGISTRPQLTQHRHLGAASSRLSAARRKRIFPRQLGNCLVNGS